MARCRSWRVESSRCGANRASRCPAFARLAPPPPPELVAARIEAYSSLGDVVVDLHGRGGWVARAAVDRQRRAASLETSPLTRLLAEVVLRPPDVRHLDAAFQAIAAAPREQSALKVWLGEKYASRCATCGRSVVLDEIVWEAVADAGPRPVHKHYRCTACRDQVGGGDQRHGAIDDGDLARIEATDPRGPAWRAVRERFPTVDADEALVEQLLDLHSPRQLLGLQAILERIEGDLRSAPVEAAMRLALLHALLPASRLNGYPGRIVNLRISGGRIRLPAGGQWRERNPWLAFEDGFRIVRGFVQRLEGAPLGLMTARFGEDLQSLSRGDGERRRPAGHAVLLSLARGRGRRARPAARPAAGPARPRPATAATECRAAVLRVLRDRLGPRPRGGLAPPARGRVRWLGPRAVGLAVGRDPAGVRGRGAAPRPGWTGHPDPRARWPGGPRRRGAGRRRGRLSACRGAPRGAGRGDRWHRRVRAARGLGSRRAANPGERRPAPHPGRGGGSGGRPGSWPVRAARALRSGSLVRGGRRPHRHRYDRGDPPGARRAGPLRAAARRDPRRTRPRRPASPARRHDARRSGRRSGARGRRGRRDRLVGRGPAGSDRRGGPHPSRQSGAGRCHPIAGRRTPTDPDAVDRLAAASAEELTAEPGARPRSGPPPGPRGRRAGRRPGRAAARHHPRRARPDHPPAPPGDRARSLVADRPGRHRVRRAAPRRPGRVVRLQPAVDRRPTLGERVQRADRRPVQRPRPARTRRSLRRASTATGAWPARPTGS